jgi:DNA invertase Pin-like site-specific DNA recombinase
MDEYPMLAYSYIRFSHSRQRAGDSIRRQVEARDKYLAEAGLTLDTSFVLIDQAVSSFRGKNAKMGRLADFLAAIRSGRIRQGSVLIVENLDRLSRDEIAEALELFLSIIRAGVKIVTLFPRQEFTKDNLDLSSLVLAIVELGRGHSESVAKSSRARANWTKRRKQLKQDIFSTRRPSWLDVTEDRQFVPNPEKTEIVRRIFTEVIAGTGIMALARKLNKEGVPSISKAARWQHSYLHKVLTNRAVLGEWQPKQQAGDRKFHPVGEPIPDYYPRVIDDDTFREANLALRSRLHSGPRSETNPVANLFTHRVFDPAGGPYCHQLHGVPGKRSGVRIAYLVPFSYATGEGPNRDFVPYLPFERHVLRRIREVKLDPDDTERVRNTLCAEEADIRERINKMKDKLRNTYSDSAMEVLAQLEDQLREVAERRAVAELPKENQLGHAQRLIDMLQNHDVRAQLKQQIAFVVQKIVIERVQRWPRKLNRRVFVTIYFHGSDQARRVWFDTRGDEAGVWSPEGRFKLADLIYEHELVTTGRRSR